EAWREGRVGRDRRPCARRRLARRQLRAGPRAGVRGHRRAAPRGRPAPRRHRGARRMSAPGVEGWRHVYSGKVRDLYIPEEAPGVEASDYLLVVASDRISAFDHVL